MTVVAPVAAPAATSPIVARAITKVYSNGQVEVPALRGVDLEVQKGEFLAIMGASGSGKSTLLHILGGLDNPTTGEVWLEGRDLAKLDDDERTLVRRTRIGFIFQSFNLLPTLTALDNVTYPLRLGGALRDESRKRAAVMLQRVGIGHRSDHYPAALSGGEQQRVAIARALVIEPSIIIADEPTGALDSARGKEIIDLLRALAVDEGHTAVMVTHDPEIGRSATRVVTLSDGRVCEPA